MGHRRMAKNMNKNQGSKARPARGSTRPVSTSRRISQPFPEEPPFEFKTDLARRMWELRQQNIAAGAKLMSVDEINEEIARRRGQRPWPDAD